jgi:hypothetical protein
MCGLSALLEWLCWEKNWGGSHGLLSRADRWSQENFFSEVVYLSNSIESAWMVAMYENYLQEEYEWRTWTSVRSICVVGIRFHLHGIHWFKSIWLSDMSNNLSCGYQQLIIGMLLLINYGLLYYNHLYCYSCLT